MRFPTSLIWSSYVAPKYPKGGAKNAKWPISVQNRTSLEESLLQVSLCENCQRQSCKAFIGLTIRAKMTGGEWRLLPEILGQSDRVAVKSPIFDLFSLAAPQPYDLAKKVQLTLIESQLRAFQWAQDGHRTLSLSPPKGGSKTQSVQNLNNELR